MKFHVNDASARISVERLNNESKQYPIELVSVLYRTVVGTAVSFERNGKVIEIEATLKDDIRVKDENATQVIMRKLKGKTQFIVSPRLLEEPKDHPHYDIRAIMSQIKNKNNEQ